MTSDDVLWATEVVVRLDDADSDEDKTVFTLHGPWNDIEDLGDHIDDEADHYGQSST